MEMSLIVIDAHYKWMEVEIISSTTYTPQATLEYLRVTFARFEAAVTDKGTCFNSRVYQV